MCKGKIKFYDSITFDHLSFDWVFLDLQHRVAKCEIKKEYITLKTRHSLTR